MNHADAIRKLMPIDLGDLSNRDIDVEGALYDAAAARILDLLSEFFPSTTTELFDRWEREYSLIPQMGASIEDRRRALQTRHASVGSLTKAHFTVLANTLGYEVEIEEGGELHNMFRAGRSAAGDPVFAAIWMWVWTVRTLNKAPGQDIIELFNDLNPPHMTLSFEGP